MKTSLALGFLAALTIAAVTVDKNTPATVGPTTYTPQLVVDGGATFNNQAIEQGYPIMVGDPIDGGSPTPRLEYGAGAMTGGSLAVTFKNAFAFAPICTCTHTDTTNTNTCTIHVAATTVGVTFAVASGGTDRVDWHCIGDK